MSIELKSFLSEEQVQEIKVHWEPFGNSPESNWELYWSSLRNRSESMGPYILSVYDENRMCGLLLGRVENGQVALRFGYWKLVNVPVRRILITSVQTHTPEDDDLLRQMLSRIVGDLGSGLADIAVFDYMPEDSKVYRVLKEMILPQRMRDKIPERWIRWHLSLPASFSDYQRKHRGFMQKVRKFERAFAGRYRYRLFSGADEIDEFCSAAEIVAQKTYQRALGVGFLNSEEDRGKMRAAAVQGAWLAYVAFLDETAIAFWSGCRFGNHVSLWWTAHDTYYHDFSPGLVSFARMTERLMAEGVTSLDFGGGDAAYKERLCNRSQWEERVCIYAPTLRGMLAKGVRGMDASLGNLTRTRLKGLADRVKTPWRSLMARKLSKREGKN